MIRHWKSQMHAHSTHTHTRPIHLITLCESLVLQEMWVLCWTSRQWRKKMVATVCVCMKARRFSAVQPGLWWQLCVDVGTHTHSHTHTHTHTHVHTHTHTHTHTCTHTHSHTHTHTHSLTHLHLRTYSQRQRYVFTHCLLASSGNEDKRIFFLITEQWVDNSLAFNSVWVQCEYTDVQYIWQCRHDNNTSWSTEHNIRSKVKLITHTHMHTHTHTHGDRELN